MSNSENTTHKVISIKDMSGIHQQESYSELNENQEEQAMSSIKVNNLQQQILDLKQQKENVLADLRESIKKEKEKWSEEKENERKQAQDLGHQEGYEAGVKEAQEAWQETLAKVNVLTDKANEDYFRTIEKHEEAIIRLSIASAGKVLRYELDENEEAFTEIIKEAIKELQDYAYIHIFVHPDEYVHVVKQKAELEQVVGTKDLISIYTDPKLSTYDCIIKHPNGQIDASIDLQLTQIKQALAEKVMEES